MSATRDTSTRSFVKWDGILLRFGRWELTIKIRLIENVISAIPDIMNYALHNDNAALQSEWPTNRRENIPFRKSREWRGRLKEYLRVVPARIVVNTQSVFSWVVDVASRMHPASVFVWCGHKVSRIFLANVPRHLSLLAFGMISCVCRRHDKSPEGTGVRWTSLFDFIFFLFDI